MKQNNTKLSGRKDPGRRKALSVQLKRHWQLYVFLIPAVVSMAVFHYGPMYGLILAFKDYKPYLGYLGSPWVGFKNFMRFFQSNRFTQVMSNTMILSAYSMIAGFPLPIVLAVCLNYVPSVRLKKTVQNITYAPHFVSTVVVVSMLNIFFARDYGLVNNIREMLGLERILYMGSTTAFRHLYVWSGVWQGVGWSSVIYFSSLSAIDETLHDVAQVDGASIIQRIRYIDLPMLKPTIVTLLILRTGDLLSVGFDKVYLMQNSLNSPVSEVISTYTYSMGIGSQQYGYSVAIGMFESVVNLIMVLTVNQISKKLSETSVW